MSTTEQTHWEGPVPTAALDGAIHEYPKDKLYLLTFAVLFAITVVEVATYFLTDFPLFRGGALVPTLLLLAAVKFFLVAYIFMHLRFDKKLLTVVFYSGLVLAVLVYVAVMTMFRLWWPDNHMVCESSPQLSRAESMVKSQTVCPVTQFAPGQAG